MGSRWTGWIVALVIGAAFAAYRLPNLRLNCQIDGQLSEYLAWAVHPETIGDSLNRELNPRLFSYYYDGLGRAARIFDRAQVIEFTFVAEILALSLGVFFLVRTLTNDPWAAWLAVVVTIWHDGLAVSPGGSGALGSVPSPEYFATAMVFAALAKCWQRRFVGAAMLAGLAFNIHGSIALFGSAMVAAAALFDARFRPNRTVVRAGLMGIVAALPTVSWIIFNPPPTATMDVSDWLRFPRWIYVNHMFPSETPVRLWLALAVFVLPGILAMLGRDRQTSADASLTTGSSIDWQPRMRILIGWIAISFILLAVGYFFVEWYPIRAVAQLTLWRGTRFLAMVLFAFGLSYLVGCLRTGGLAAALAAMALTGYMAPVYPELTWIGHLGLAGLVGLVAVRSIGLERMVAGTLSAALVGILVYDASCFERLGDHLAMRWPIMVCGLAILLYWCGRLKWPLLQATSVVCMTAAAAWLFRLDVGPTYPSRTRHRAAAVLKLAPTIEKLSLPGELVVAPPDVRNPGAWANRGSFLCRQQLTAYAYAPWIAGKIIDRMSWYLGESPEALGADHSIVRDLVTGYHDRSSADFARIREKYGVRLAIVEQNQHLAYRQVASSGEFAVYDLADPVP